MNLLNIDLITSGKIGIIIYSWISPRVGVICKVVLKKFMKFFLATEYRERIKLNFSKQNIQ